MNEDALETTIFEDGSRIFKVNGHDVFGYCRYLPFYRDCVEVAKDGWHFVEVGSFLGQSSCVMAYYIKKSGKDIKFDCVDLFEISDYSDDKHEEYVKEHGGDFFKAFLYNIVKAEADNYINTIHKGHSVNAAEEYTDDSLNMVYLDASHETLDLYLDMKAWYPKLKEGGIFAGDDWDHEGVPKAVAAFMINNNIPQEKLNVVSYGTWFFKK